MGGTVLKPNVLGYRRVGQPSNYSMDPSKEFSPMFPRSQVSTSNNAFAGTQHVTWLAVRNTRWQISMWQGSVASALTMVETFTNVLSLTKLWNESIRAVEVWAQEDICRETRIVEGRVVQLCLAKPSNNTRVCRYILVRPTYTHGRQGKLRNLLQN